MEKIAHKGYTTGQQFLQHQQISKDAYQVEGKRRAEQAYKSLGSQEWFYAGWMGAYPD